VTITPAILIRTAAALIRPQVPAVADWLGEQAAMAAPSPHAVRIGLAYLGEVPRRGGARMSHTFTDRYGTALQIGGEASFAGCARLTVSKLCGIHVEAADFPALIAALYEAAGLPAPVILERPDADDDSAGLIPGLRFTARDGVVEVERPGGNWQIGPAKVRKFAAALAVLADEAESGPDPAEVEELAYVLRAVTPGMAYPGEGDYRLAVARGFAEAALKWMRDKRQREEGAS